MRVHQELRVVAAGDWLVDVDEAPQTCRFSGDICWWPAGECEIEERVFSGAIVDMKACSTAGLECGDGRISVDRRGAGWMTALLAKFATYQLWCARYIAAAPIGSC